MFLFLQQENQERHQRFSCGHFNITCVLQLLDKTLIWWPAQMRAAFWKSNLSWSMRVLASNVRYFSKMIRAPSIRPKSSTILSLWCQFVSRILFENFLKSLKYDWCSFRSSIDRLYSSLAKCHKWIRQAKWKCGFSVQHLHHIGARDILPTNELQTSHGRRCVHSCFEHQNSSQHFVWRPERFRQNDFGIFPLLWLSLRNK